MRRQLCTLAVLLCAACSAPEETFPVPVEALALTIPTTVAHDPDYLTLADKLCHWNRVNRAWVKGQRKFNLLSRTWVRDAEEHLFTMLRDRRMANCWQRTAEAITIAGTPSQVMRLLEHVRRFEVGQWPVASDSLQLMEQAMISRALGIAAHRFAGTRTAEAIITHLRDCMQPSWWMGPRAVNVHSMDGYSPAERQATFAQLSSFACIKGMRTAAAFNWSAMKLLEEYRTTIIVLQYDFVIWRVDWLIQDARQLATLGMDAWIKRNGVWF